MNPPNEYHNILWKDNALGQSGRVLVNMERRRDSRLDVYNYEGSELPAFHIYAVLQVALPEGWVETLEKLHQNRRTKWQAKMFMNPDGEREYRLYTLRENMGQNEPVCSSVIAISHKQIHTFSILLEDAAPLLKKIIKDYPPVFLPRYRDNRHTPCFPTFYYLLAQNIKFRNLPGIIKEQREQKYRITDRNIFLFEPLQAGETSGIIETIEALKCMEVLQA